MMGVLTRPVTVRFGLALSLALSGGLLPITSLQAQSGGAGRFENHHDVGDTRHAGAVEYNAARGAYTVTGGGANMWFTNDAFHFVWKKVSNDVMVAADIQF